MSANPAQSSHCSRRGCPTASRRPRRSRCPTPCRSSLRGAGDSNEHTQLFTALARSLDIPTRIASGLEYAGGRFYYHSWPEVFLGDWVAVDPTFGQFPADAAHIRLAIGGLERQAELLRLIATLHIEVLATR